VSARLDARLDVETPEGVALELRVAGPIARALAWGIDLSIRLAALLLASLFLGLLGAAGSGVMFLIAFASEWLYPVLFEVYNGGRTPGKLALGLAAVRDDGTPLGWSESSLRNLLRAADFLPGTYLVGFLSMLCNPEFRRLGDLAAGTLVVHADSGRGRALRLPDARPRPPAVPLALDEQRAVIAFAQRVPELTPERASELASLARPLVEGSDEPVRALLGHAAWLIGRRP
jgi:uncharacterized RDD family membrane protein YckC